MWSVILPFRKIVKFSLWVSSGEKLYFLRHYKNVMKEVFHHCIGKLHMIWFKVESELGNEAHTLCNYTTWNMDIFGDKEKTQALKLKRPWLNCLLAKWPRTSCFLTLWKKKGNEEHQSPTHVIIWIYLTMHFKAWPAEQVLSKWFLYPSHS